MEKKPEQVRTLEITLGTNHLKTLTKEIYIHKQIISDVLHDFVTQRRQKVREKECVQFTFHVLPLLWLEVHPLQVMVITALHKKATPLQPSDAHLPHHLKIVFVCGLQAKATISLTTQVLAIPHAPFVGALDLQEAVRW